MSPWSSSVDRGRPSSVRSVVLRAKYRQVERSGGEWWYYEMVRCIVGVVRSVSVGVGQCRSVSVGGGRCRSVVKKVKSDMENGRYTATIQNSNVDS